jgi:hypothetical protein
MNVVPPASCWTLRGFRSSSHNSSAGTVLQELPVGSRIAAGPIRPVSDDGNQVRGLVPDGTADTLTGTALHDETAVDRIPRGPRQ